MPWRMACVSPPRGFRLNRSIPGIKTCWRQRSFRGVAAVDRGDHRISRIFKILGLKSCDLAPGAAPRVGTYLALFTRVMRSKLAAYQLRATIEPLSGHCRAPWATVERQGRSRHLSGARGNTFRPRAARAGFRFTDVYKTLSNAPAISSDSRFTTFPLPFLLQFYIVYTISIRVSSAVSTKRLNYYII